MSGTPGGPVTLVVGATGKTGSEVVHLLREAGQEVRAMVRTADARTEGLRAAGADVVMGDLFDPRSVQAALAGVERVYYAPPWHPHMLDATAVLAVEARRAGVRHIVHMSQWLAHPEHPSLATRQHWLADELLSGLPGITHTTLNPGFFADNYLGNGLIGIAAQTGLLPLPVGMAGNPAPSNRDMARVAVACLIDPERHAGATYRPTGPQTLTPGQMAEQVGAVLGRRVRHVDLPLSLFVRYVRASGRRYGYRTWHLADLRWYMAESRRGTWEVAAPTSDVQDVTGTPAETFMVTAERYTHLPEIRRTPGNLMRVTTELLLSGILPALSLDRWVRDQHQPRPAKLSLSIDSPAWRATHERPLSTDPSTVPAGASQG